MLVNTGMTLVSYEVFTSPGVKGKLLSPVPEGSVQGSSTKVEEEPYPLNLTRASNWFSGVDPDLTGVDWQAEGVQESSNVKFYNLSIPALSIEDAVVEVGGDDLSKSLIHYKGDSLPGRLGGVVVFGHSTIPQLFNPKNYLSIFSTLPTIDLGDEVIVKYDGKTYVYRVEEKFEVKPSDTWVLEARHDDSYLTLITCTPPGTYLRRLVVKARLESR